MGKQNGQRKEDNNSAAKKREKSGFGSLMSQREPK
jgi:hypothetical protein